MYVFPCNYLSSSDKIQSAEGLPLLQGWLPQPEIDFQPGFVRCGWIDNALVVSAELKDQDVFNPVTHFNEPSFNRGDVFEIFLRSLDREEYVELHVNPNNTPFQLRIPSMDAFYKARETEGLRGNWFIREKGFKSRVELSSEGWKVQAQIPFSLIKGCPSVQRGEEWLFSFCRYDYTRGRNEPVLSSTSAFSRPDYHHQNDWKRLKFC